MTFLLKETSFVSKKFFATCCVIVDAPSSLLFCVIFFIFFIIALNIPLASIPGCLKKFLSSAERKAFTTLSGIDSMGINSLFSIAYSAISFLSSE